MIAYFDTSAVVPMLVPESGSLLAREHWLAADRVASVALTRVETHAALTRRPRHALAATRLDDIFRSITFLDVSDAILARAVDVTHAAGLRAYDAVHLAAALSIADGDDVLFVAGDRALLDAASEAGLATAATS